MELLPFLLVSFGNNLIEKHQLLFTPALFFLPTVAVFSTLSSFLQKIELHMTPPNHRSNRFEYIAINYQ